MGNHHCKRKVSSLTTTHRQWDKSLCTSNESPHSTFDSGYDTVHHEDSTARGSVMKAAEHWNEDMIRKSNSRKTTRQDIQAILRKLASLQKTCDEDKLAGRYVEKGNFSAGFFTHQGGTLKIGNQACLYIPPDALPETGVHLIYIYIDSADIGGEGLNDGNQWLTPVVECGPDGQQFHRNVLLSVLMLNNFSLRSTTAHFKNGAMESKREWHTLEKNLSVRGNKVVFEVDHFTGFTASGHPDTDEHVREPKETKLITAAVFVEPNTEQDADIVSIRWCEFQHYEEMLKEEGALHLLSNRNPTPSVQVENCNKDVVFRLVKDNAEFPSGNGIQIQNIKCSDIWKGHSGEVRFLMEYKIDKDIFVEIFQEPNERILLIPYTNVINTGRLESEAKDTREEILFLNQQPDLNPSPRSLQFMSDKTFRRLCIILEGMDNVAMVNQGWRSLAEKCGIVENQVVACIEMRAKYQQRSPAAIVLDHFFSRYPWEQAYDVMGYLRDLLLEMGNHDARMLVDSELRTLCPVNMVNCQSAITPKNDAELPGRRRRSISAMEQDFVPSGHHPIRSYNIGSPQLQLPLDTDTNERMLADEIQHSSYDDSENQDTGDGECSCFAFYCGLRIRSGRHSEIRDKVDKIPLSVRRESNVSGESGYISNFSSPSIPSIRTKPSMPSVVETRV